MEPICVVVEGLSDKRKLQQLFAEQQALIICTNGTKDEEALLELLEPFEDYFFVSMFDRDATGDYLRKQMRRIYSEAKQLHVPAPYRQVADTPVHILKNIFHAAKIDVK